MTTVTHVTAGRHTGKFHCHYCGERWTPPAGMPVELYLEKARQFVAEHVKCQVGGAAAVSLGANPRPQGSAA